MGNWAYAPPGPGAATATLHDAAHQTIPLRHSAALVQDLLARLARIETAYTAAAGLAHAPAPSLGESPGTGYTAAADLPHAYPAAADLPPAPAPSLGESLESHGRA